MKKVSILILVSLISYTAWSQQVKKRKVFRHLKTIYTDLNNDGIIDTISLSSSLDEHFLFNRISIKLAGLKKQSFIAKVAWTDVDKEFLDSNKNAINTDMLFLKKIGKQTVILLFGQIYGAGYRDAFSIINIENDNIKMVFDDDNSNNKGLDIESPITLKPLNSQGRLCFVYKNMGEVYKQVKGGYIGTYVPYFVYSVTNDCKIDTALTKAYNEEHYVYAGLKFSDKIQIFYPDNKKHKPKLWYFPKNTR